MTLHHDPIAAMGELLRDLRADTGMVHLREAPPEETGIRCPACSMHKIHGAAYLDREPGVGSGDGAWRYTCGCGFECGELAARAIEDLVCTLDSATARERDLRRYLIRVGVEVPDVRWEGVEKGAIAHAMLRGTLIAACGRRPIVAKVQGPKVWSPDMPDACPRCWSAIAESGPLSLEVPR